MSVVSLTDYQPRERYDDNAWTAVDIEGSEDLITWTLIQHIDFTDEDADPSTPATRNFTVTVDDPDTAYIRVVWIDDDSNRDVTDPISLVEPTILATVRDVELRLGYSLTTDLAANQVATLLGSATTMILNSLDKDATWVVPPNVKPILSALCVEVVVRARSNPEALGQRSKTLGSYSESVTFAREIPGSGLMLTTVEELLIRRAVYGQNAGTGRSWQRDLYLYGQESALLEPPTIIE